MLQSQYWQKKSRPMAAYSWIGPHQAAPYADVCVWHEAAKRDVSL
jgi:hypothetical protein